MISPATREELGVELLLLRVERGQMRWFKHLLDASLGMDGLWMDGLFHEGHICAGVGEQFNSEPEGLLQSDSGSVLLFS